MECRRARHPSEVGAEFRKTASRVRRYEERPEPEARLRPGLLHGFRIHAKNEFTVDVVALAATPGAPGDAHDPNPVLAVMGMPCPAPFGREALSHWRR